MRGGQWVECESSLLNKQGLTSASGLGDVSTGTLGHGQSGKDLKDKQTQSDSAASLLKTKQ